MNAISIKGLKVLACHGVLPTEKVNAQPFVFDIAIDCNILPACKSDDVLQTVNYAEVCDVVVNYCKNNCFNLIERLAYGVAQSVINSFPQTDSVQVTVHKPQAPIRHEFSDVTVSVSLSREKVVLSLGSSQGDRQKLLDFAIERLSETDGVKMEKISKAVVTEPYGGVAKNKFLNCAVLISTTLSPDELLSVIHKIEEEGGRVRKNRWEDRTLDIDIIFFGNRVIQTEGLCVPHPDYHNRDFVLEPLKEIIPNFVCPRLHKRISDL